MPPPGPKFAHSNGGEDRRKLCRIFDCMIFPRSSCFAAIQAYNSVITLSAAGPCTHKPTAKCGLGWATRRPRRVRMSAIGPKADMPKTQSMSLLGVKRTRYELQQRSRRWGRYVWVPVVGQRQQVVSGVAIGMIPVVGSMRPVLVFPYDNFLAIKREDPMLLL